MKTKDFIAAIDLINIKKRGIYSISCRYKKDMYYVGSTIRTFHIRWCNHIYSLKNGTHENSKLQRIVKKYGIESLQFKILEIADDNTFMFEKEMFWINKLNSVKNGYNLAKYINNSWSARRTENFLKKHFYKIVSQYDLNGNYIQTFKSMKDASKQTKTDYVTISSVCNNKASRIANGFQWKFGANKKNIGATRGKSAKTIYKYDKSGNYICTFSTFKEAAKSVNRAPNSISRAVTTGRMSNGFFWCLIKQEKIILVDLKRGRQIKLS